MECQKVRELADSYLSGQLLIETNHEVVRHLETCPDCRHDLAVRRELRDRLKAALLNAPSLQPRPEFSSELRARLQPATPLVSRREALRTWGSLAAGLLVSTAGGVVLWRRRQESSALTALARQAAGDHQNCAVRFNLAEHPIPLDEAGRQFGVPYSALANFDPAPIAGTVRVIDRHACVYDGRRFAHIVFEVDGRLVSLLVTTGEVPDSPVAAAPADGRAVVTLPAGRYAAFLVSDHPVPRVMEMARALMAPLAQRLS